MASLLFCLLLLPAPSGLPGTAALPLVRAIDLDAAALTADPSPVAADTLALVVECSREAFYKLSERGAVLAAGRLLPGANALRFTRPGLAAISQSLFLVLDLLEQDAPAQKFLRLRVKVAGRSETGPGEAKGLSGSFRLDMYHGGRLFGYRKKSMAELLKLKTGPVIAVPDPGLSGAAGRTPAAGQSVSVLGLGMALAKYLAGKKAEKRMKAFNAESQKRSLALTITRQGADGQERKIPVEIELHVE
ncbi:MAG: hypothetical protein MUC72_06895 [Acidobacteria bacterium]|jgi:hypothetical protein|nr:hypothetical protein [Acidobacteriota bacterium]